MKTDTSEKGLEALVVMVIAGELTLGTPAEGVSADVRGDEPQV